MNKKKEARNFFIWFGILIVSFITFIALSVSFPGIAVSGYPLWLIGIWVLTGLGTIAGLIYYVKFVLKALKELSNEYQSPSLAGK